MPERLYVKLRLRDGRKAYAPTIHAGHRALVYRTAHEAEAHSRAVRARYERLKRAGRTNGAHK